jgi:hypothetical protein
VGLLILGPVEMPGPTASFAVRGVKIRNALALLVLNLDRVAASFTFRKDIDACDMLLDDGDRTTVDLPAGGTTCSGAVVRAAAYGSTRRPGNHDPPRINRGGTPCSRSGGLRRIHCPRREVIGHA